MPSETSIYRAILRAIEKQYGTDARVVKMHGSQFTGPGLQDLIGCIQGRSVALEVKRPGEVTRPAQSMEIGLWKRAGAISGSVSSVAEAINLIEKELPWEWHRL